eukprot:GHVN01027423.1.p1 GENE.GHVN01027423.1~~GHVN01027423.1.p1  ORF type:complete len:794 (-),score=207.17 GHVN01027423.1:150-2531(-)
MANSMFIPLNSLPSLPSVPSFASLILIALFLFQLSLVDASYASLADLGEASEVTSINRLAFSEMSQKYFSPLDYHRSDPPQSHRFSPTQLNRSHGLIGGIVSRHSQKMSEVGELGELRSQIREVNHLSEVREVDEGGRFMSHTHHARKRGEKVVINDVTLLPHSPPHSPDSPHSPLSPQIHDTLDSPDLLDIPDSPPLPYSPTAFEWLHQPSARGVFKANNFVPPDASHQPSPPHLPKSPKYSSEPFVPHLQGRFYHVRQLQGNSPTVLPSEGPDDTDPGASYTVAFILTTLAGLSTVVGSAVAFCLPHSSPLVTAFCPAVSAGVMIYVSFIELFVESMSSFSEIDGVSDEMSYTWATITLFGGVAGSSVIEIITHLVMRKCGWSEGSREKRETDPGATATVRGAELIEDKEGEMTPVTQRNSSLRRLSCPPDSSYANNSSNGDQGNIEVDGVIGMADGGEVNAISGRRCYGTDIPAVGEVRPVRLVRGEASHMTAGSDTMSHMSEQSDVTQASEVSEVSDDTLAPSPCGSVLRSTESHLSPQPDFLSGSPTATRPTEPLQSTRADQADAQLTQVTHSDPITHGEQENQVNEVRGDVSQVGGLSDLRTDQANEGRRVSEVSGRSDVSDDRCKMVETDGSISLMETSALTGIALVMHNIPEGLATFNSALGDVRTGVSVAIAIAIHNIPEGIALSSLVYYATGSRWKGFMWSSIAGLAEPLGGVLAFVILQAVGISPLVFAISFGLVAGVMIHVSFRKLLPVAFHYDPKDKVVSWSVLGGMLVMAVSLVILHVV